MFPYCDGKPFHGIKASTLNLIEPPDETLTIVSLADTYIVDLSVEVHTKASKYDCVQKTIKDFVLYVLNSIADKAKYLSVKHIDIVADFYNALSVKSSIRSARGSSSRTAVNRGDILPENFPSRLAHSNFKGDLNSCFSSENILE